MTAFDSFDLDAEMAGSRLLRTSGRQGLRVGEAALAAAVERRWEVERLLHEAVAGYRLAGASWAQVARVLRTDEQSARARFCRRGTDPHPPAAGEHRQRPGRRGGRPRAGGLRRGVLQLLRGGQPARPG
ncbi:hypothetical protein GTQ99_10945 [Kineococcus sp. T13]|uniref:hypothetical protein n=1 Tax=Kineococcus vitellinus TaxID=2696565 RepID=UPI001413700A|nr:hypothetical protein [Kineococcus vitellinus]NAZ75925.1 hypothetical protein [Kineococcus vitellinus]